MDREPLPPPFPVGTRLRYVGDRTEGIPYSGLTVWIADVADPIPATGSDGYSVYQAWVRGEHLAYVIWPKDAHDWEVIDD